MLLKPHSITSLCLSCLLPRPGESSCVLVNLFLWGLTSYPLMPSLGHSGKANSCLKFGGPALLFSLLICPPLPSFCSSSIPSSSSFCPFTPFSLLSSYFHPLAFLYRILAACSPRHSCSLPLLGLLCRTCVGVGGGGPSQAVCSSPDFKIAEG